MAAILKSNQSKEAHSVSCSWKTKLKNKQLVVKLRKICKKLLKLIVKFHHCELNVLYFDQQTGAPHAVRWLK